MQKTTARPWAIGLIVLGALIRCTQALNLARLGSRLRHTENPLWIGAAA